MKKLIALFLLIILANSCQRIADEYYKDKSIKNYTSPYQGNWAGNYTGQLNGALQITVYKSGSMEIKRTFGSQTEIFYGQVYDDGVFLGGTSSTGFKLMGSLFAKGGTWRFETFTGNWTVTKQ